MASARSGLLDPFGGPGPWPAGGGAPGSRAGSFRSTLSIDDILAEIAPEPRGSGCGCGVGGGGGGGAAPPPDVLLQPTGSLGVGGRQAPHAALPALPRIRVRVPDAAAEEEGRCGSSCGGSPVATLPGVGQPGGSSAGSTLAGGSSLGNVPSSSGASSAQASPFSGQCGGGPPHSGAHSHHLGHMVHSFSTSYLPVRARRPAAHLPACPPARLPC